MMERQNNSKHIFRNSENYMRHVIFRLSGLLSIYALMLIFSCSADDPELVNCDLSDLVISATEQNPTSCSANDGIISASAVGGDEPYKFALNTGSFDFTSTFNNLGSGDYTVRVKDKNGCETSVELILEVPGSDPLKATTVSIADTECLGNNGSIEVLASGGAPPYQYKIGTSSYGDVSIFNDLSPGNYSIAVKDATDCVFTIGATVTQGITQTSLLIDIEPIIDVECAITNCHNGNEQPDLRSASQIIANASQIKSVTQSNFMPRNGSLTSSQKALIACWVDDGAKNN